MHKNRFSYFVLRMVFVVANMRGKKDEGPISIAYGAGCNVGANLINRTILGKAINKEIPNLPVSVPFVLFSNQLSSPKEVNLSLEDIKKIISDDSLKQVLATKNSSLLSLWAKLKVMINKKKPYLLDDVEIGGSCDLGRKKEVYCSVGKKLASWLKVRVGASQSGQSWNELLDLLKQQVKASQSSSENNPTDVYALLKVSVLKNVALNLGIGGDLQKLKNREKPSPFVGISIGG